MGCRYLLLTPGVRLAMRSGGVSLHYFLITLTATHELFFIKKLLTNSTIPNNIL